MPAVETAPQAEPITPQPGDEYLVLVRCLGHDLPSCTFALRVEADRYVETFDDDELDRLCRLFKLGSVEPVGLSLVTYRNGHPIAVEAVGEWADA